MYPTQPGTVFCYVCCYLPDKRDFTDGKYRSTEEIPVGTFHSPAVVQKQDEVECTSSVAGPSPGWSEVQQRYYEWIGGSRRSGLRWLTASNSEIR
jgi:hypothetical protein